MTDQKQKQETAVVTAAPGSRLGELLGAYGTAKADAEEAAARFKSVTDALKAELSAARPGAESIVLSGAPNLPALRLAWRRSWRLNTGRLREEQPYMYVRYSEESGHWELRAQQ